MRESPSPHDRRVHDGSVIEKLPSIEAGALVEQKGKRFQMRFSILGPSIVRSVPNESGSLHMQLMGKVD